MPTFNDTTIEQLFGADDAENEEEARFLEYFYYNNAYDSLVSDLPIRILVGHKGVGKSALLKRAFIADRESQNFGFWIRPNDLLDIKNKVKNTPDFIVRIEAWKQGILIETLRAFFTTAFGKSAEQTHHEIRNARTQVLMDILIRGLKETGRADSVYTVYVRRQSFWDIERGHLREALARLVDDVRRLADDAASVGWRWCVV